LQRPEETGLTGRDALDQERTDLWGTLVAPLLRQFWMIVLIVTVGALSSLAYSRMQAPSFEASAVVQARPDADVTAAMHRLTSRDNLVAMVVRHGIGSGDTAGRAAVRLGQSIAVRDLTSSAGSTLGLQPQTSGIVVSVLWPDAEVSARIANDLAQQILDSGNSGTLDADFEDLSFYRREEMRLWQEIGALQAELDQLPATDGPEVSQRLLSDGHRLTLMQDEYALIRERLAGIEVDSRLAAMSRKGQFSLLQRATATEAVSVVRNWMLVGVAGSLLLAVALAFVLERRYPSLQRGPWDDFGVANQRLLHLYRFFDDPERPIMGVPRFVVVAFVVVSWLVAIALMMR
jgi:hypothetical protein